MLKRRNRVYRRIAVALTVALLAGQSHAFVLAEEGDTPQTEITGEVEMPDNGNVADGGNADNGSGENAGGTEQGGGNGGMDNQNPEDNESQGDQQGDGDEQDKCVCGTKCVADAVNTDCPVCVADYIACTGQADDAGNNGSENNGSENGDTENNDPENGGQDQCVCETACTEEAVNVDCPVCAADYANCAKRAGEGVNPSVDAALPEMTPGNMADEEADIDALADEGVEAYAVGEEFTIDLLRYRVMSADGEVGEIEVIGYKDGENLTGSLIIPEKVTDQDSSKIYRVTGIGESAFDGCKGLIGITIPDSVTSIGPYAFQECVSLGSITIPNGVTDIGEFAFNECASLSSIAVPDSVASIGDRAFSYCSNLDSIIIPDGVTAIGKKIFVECKNLSSVTIPDSVTSIGESAFDGCSSLSGITIPDSVTSIERCAFYNCSGLNSITIPDSVTSIKEFAFHGCSKLSSIRISKNLTSIEDETFSGCRNLNNITIPNGVTSIGMDAFGACSSLSNITIPDSVTSIGPYAFCECTSLNSIVIPDNVTNLKFRTFYCCNNLERVKISDKVSEIVAQAFSGCTKLKTMQIVVTSNETISPPTVGDEAFLDVPDERDIIFLAGADTESMTLERAKTEYLKDDRDGDGTDELWQGWKIKVSASEEKFYIVTINVRKDDTPWTDHNRTFALTKDGGATFVTDLDAVEAGTYEIYDVTDSGNKLNTGVTVTVADADVSATVDYYTVAFYDYDVVAGETAYGNDTPWKPQTVLKDAGRVAVPATNPTKADHTFDKWVTAQNGDDAFAFAATPITAAGTKIYAKWTENTVTTYYTVTFYDGTSPYGADTPQKPQRVASGQQADRPEDPDKAGWEFAGWKTADGGSTSYDFDTPVIGDTSIYASWVEKTVIDSLRIQATATEGGTIVPKGEIIVSKGGERTFTITPDEGNRIKAVTVDGEDVTAELKDTLARAQTGARYYTFTNIIQNHTIHAEFERDGSSSGGGGGGGDHSDPGGDNPGGGGDNPNPGGGSGGGGGDNPDPDDDDDGKKPGGGGNSDGGDHSHPGGGNNGGGTNPDGGNGTGNMVNADNGNGAGNGQTVAGAAVSSAQAGGGAATVSAGNHAASDGSKAAGESGGAANGREPKTGDASYLEVYATLAMIAGLTYLLLYVMEESRGMSEREKEAFVAAFIRWGKKGGAFRKCCAMAAIFCLLAYYHTIGKRAGENALREKYLGLVPD